MLQQRELRVVLLVAAQLRLCHPPVLLQSPHLLFACEDGHGGRRWELWGAASAVMAAEAWGGASGEGLQTERHWTLTWTTRTTRDGMAESCGTSTRAAARLRSTSRSRWLVSSSCRVCRSDSILRGGGVVGGDGVATTGQRHQGHRLTACDYVWTTCDNV